MVPLLQPTVDERIEVVTVDEQFATDLTCWQFLRPDR
jgi:hypothetical protein